MMRKREEKKNQHNLLFRPFFFLFVTIQNSQQPHSIQYMMCMRLNTFYLFILCFCFSSSSNANWTAQNSIGICIDWTMCVRYKLNHYFFVLQCMSVCKIMFIFVSFLFFSKQKKSANEPNWIRNRWETTLKHLIRSLTSYLKLMNACQKSLNYFNFFFLRSNFHLLHAH